MQNLKNDKSPLSGKGEGGEWKTINGAHVFIEDGQNVKDAMNWKFSQLKSGSKKPSQEGNKSVPQREVERRVFNTLSEAKDAYMRESSPVVYGDNEEFDTIIELFGELPPRTIIDTKLFISKNNKIGLLFNYSIGVNEWDRQPNNYLAYKEGFEVVNVNDDGEIITDK